MPLALVAPVAGRAPALPPAVWWLWWLLVALSALPLYNCHMRASVCGDRDVSLTVFPLRLIRTHQGHQSHQVVRQSNES